MLTITRVPAGWKWDLDEEWPKFMTIILGENKVVLTPNEARNLHQVFNDLKIMDWKGGDNEPSQGGNKSGVLG